MILFTCKKYNFLIEKNLPSLPAASPQNQVWAELVSQRICRNSDRFILKSKHLWGWLWLPTGRSSSLCEESTATLRCLLTNSLPTGRSLCIFQSVNEEVAEVVE